MIKIRLAATLALCATMLLSCVKQELEGGGNGSEKVSVTLSLDIPTSEIVTRATVDEDAARENGISHLDVLFFDAAGANSSDPLFTKRYRLDYVSTVETGKIRAVIKDMPTGTYMVMVVANAESADFSGMIETTTTLAQAKSRLITQRGNTMPSAFIPMAGMSNAVETINSENQLLRTITLYRTVARFDLQCELATVTNNSFELVSAEVRNARTAGYLFGQSPLSDKNSVSVPSVAMIADYVRPEISGDTPPHADANGTIEAQLYALENSVADPTAQKNETTCIILGGKFNKSAHTTYYRVNIQNSNGKYVIKRNHRYIIRILSVIGPGYGTKQEAEEGLINNLKVEIESWIDGSAGIAIEGNHMMSVSQTDFQFDKMSANKTGSFTVRLKNIDPNTFFIGQDETSRWLSIANAGSFTKGADDIWSATYTFRIAESNTTPDTRTGTFTLRHTGGALYLKVVVEQLNSARINLSVAPQELSSKAVTAHKVDFNFTNANYDDPTSGLQWNVESGNTWLHINASEPSTGRGQGSFYIDLDEFTNTGFSRQGNVRMALTEADGNKIYYDIPIKQFASGTILDGLTFDRVQFSLKIPDEGYSVNQPFIIKVVANTSHTIVTEEINPAQWSISLVPTEIGYKLIITATAVPDRSTTDQYSVGTYRIGYIHFNNARGERVRTLMLYQGYVKTVTQLQFYDPGKNQKYSEYTQTGYGVIPDDENAVLTYELVAHGQRVWLDRNINAMKAQDGKKPIAAIKDLIGTMFYNPHSNFYKHENSLVELSNRTIGPCPPGFRIPNSKDALKMKVYASSSTFSNLYTDDSPLLLYWELFNSHAPLFNEGLTGNTIYIWHSGGSIYDQPISSYPVGVIRCVSIR